MATKLESEKAAQSAHVKKVKNKLKEIKASLFASSDQHNSVETIDVRHVYQARPDQYGARCTIYGIRYTITSHAVMASNRTYTHYKAL